MKRILSLILTLALICAAFPASAESLDGVLTAQEIQTCLALAAMDGQSAGWSAGSSVSERMDALQVQQYLTWLLEDGVGGLVRRMEDGAQLERATGGTAYGNAALMAQAQRLYNEIAAYRGEVEDARRAIYADLQRWDGATQTERKRITVRVRESERRIQKIRAAVVSAGYAARLQSQTKGFNAADDSYPAAQTQLMAQAQRLTQAESGVGFAVQALSGRQFGFVVRDDKGDPLSGANVTVVCSGDAAYRANATTDSDGLAVFWVKDFQPDSQGRVKVDVSVQGDKRCTREMRRLRLRGGMTESVWLAAYDGHPFLRRVGYNSGDILSQTKTLFYTPKNNATQQIDVLVDDFAAGQSGTLVLSYQTLGADGALCEAEERASFTAGTPVTFSNAYAKLIAPGATVSIRVETPGFTRTVDTQLISKKAVVDEPVYRDADALTVSGSVGLKNPDGVPFIGGRTLSMAVSGLNGQLVVEPTGFARFAYGENLKSETQDWRQESEADAQQRADEADKQNRRSENLVSHQVYGTTGAAGSMALFDDAAAEIQAFGGMVGRVWDGAAQLELEGVGGLAAAFKRGYTWQFAVFDDMPALAGMDMAFALGKTFALGLTADGVGLNGLRLSVNQGQGAKAEIRPDLGVTAGAAMRSLANAVLRFDGRMFVDWLLGSPAGTTVALGMGLSVTAQTFLSQWTQNLWVSDPNSLSGVTDPGERATDIAASGNNTRGSNTIQNDEGLMAETETEVFSRIDTLAQDIQYATLANRQTGALSNFAFFITPVSENGQTRKAELVWYNLDDPTIYGKVYPTSGGDEWRGETASDYAFAVTAQNHYAAFSILSGTFADGSEKPTESRMALAVMRLTDDGKRLELANLYFGVNDAYRSEGCGNDDAKLPKSESGNVLTMPTMHFSAYGGGSWYLNAACNVEKAENGETESVKSIDLQASTSGGSRPTATITLYDPVEDTASEIGAGATRRLTLGTPNGARPSYYRLYAAGKEAGGALQLFVNGTAYALDDDVVFMETVPVRTNSTSSEFVFYIKRGQADDGSDCYRLMGAQREVINNSITIRDYDVPMYAERFQLVTLDDGSPYGQTFLYWMENATEGESGRAIYRVKGVKFDRESNTMTAPFTLAELSQRPTGVYIGADGTGYYTTDRIVIQSARSGGSAVLSQSLYTFQLVLKADAALTGAAAYDPCLRAGDYAEMLISVKNTGSLPLSGFGLNLMYQGTTFQTVSVNCENPETASVNSLFGDAAASAYSIARADSVFDHDNGDLWLITSQSRESGNTATDVIRTHLLMPGGVHVYRIVFKVPEDWNGGTNLTAQVTNLSASIGSMFSGGSSSNIIDFAPNGNLLGTSSDAYALGKMTFKRVKYVEAQNTRAVEIGRGDLMLDSQPYVAPNGQEFVRVNVVGRGRTDSAAPPTLTAQIDGQTVLTYTFKNAIDADFGYTLDIPAAKLLGGRMSGDVTLTVTDNEAGSEFAPFDNARTVTLGRELLIVEHPQDAVTLAGMDASFTVAASGGRQPYTFQWQKRNAKGGWVNVSGANEAELKLSAVTMEMNGMQVRCVVRDFSGNEAVSNPATLTVGEPLTIVEHPQDVNTLAGADAVFTVAASGGRQPYTYQWQKRDAKGGWANIGGANEAQLTLSAVAMKTSGTQVRCIVRDSGGSEAVSEAATLTVWQPLPQTGDAQQPMLFALMLAAALLALAVIRKKKA